MALETDAGEPVSSGAKKTTRTRATKTAPKPRKTKAKPSETATQVSGKKNEAPAIAVKKARAVRATVKRTPPRRKPETASPAAIELVAPAPPAASSAWPATDFDESRTGDVILKTATVIAAPVTPGKEASAAIQTDRPRRERGRRGGRRTRGRRGRGRGEDRGPTGETAKKPALEHPVLARGEDEKGSEAQPDDDVRGEGLSNGVYLPGPVAERGEVEAGAQRGRRGRRGRGRGGHDGIRMRAELSAPSAEGVDDELPQEVVPDEDVGDDDAPTDGAMRDMIINVSAGDECRIAVVHEGRLEELFIERSATQSHVGNIYKGRVTNVEPSIQAAFIDFGLPKNGFLHISDVQPQYFPNHKGESEDVGRKIPRHHRPPIQKCFRRGQEVIAQITKEGVGTKGPTLTTYLSIPGRFLVMMPGMSQVGVSRKIEDDATRRKMRDMLGQLDLPPGIGFILRTAGLDRTKRELQRDLHYLQRLWKTVVDRVKNLPTPAELYRESDLVIRTIRDIYSPEFRRLVVDDAATAERAREFLQVAMPRSKSLVELYTDREPLFHRFGIEQEIERINMRHVPLRSGGSLVIDTTEAMVTIDVNSGKFRTLDDAEETAFRINVEAAEEIARQLRLRDLGGLLVCDFIDMRQDRHKRAVEKALRDALKKHKERARILRMSAFGIIEMTRQRQGPSLKKNIYYDCPHCRGAGVVKMPESVILDVMRLVQLAAHHEQVSKITVTVSTDVAFRILNKKRATLSQIETETGKSVLIRGEPGFTSDQVECACEDARGQLINVPSLPQPPVRG